MKTFVMDIEGDPHAPLSRFPSILRALISDSFIYLVGSAISGLAGFALVPLYTRTLHPDEFGIYALVDVTILIFCLVTQLKLDVAYLKTFADLSESRRTELVSSVIITTSSFAIVGGAILAFLALSPLGATIFQTKDQSFTWMLLPIVVFENLFGILLSDQRARRKAATYCTSTILRLLATVVSSVWFLSVQHMRLYGLFAGRLTGDLAGVVFLIFACRRTIKARFDSGLLRPMIRFSGPLVWSALMAMLMDATGRYALIHYRTLADVGYLGAAVKISGIFQMLVSQPFGIAWGGLMFQIVKWPNARAIYSKIFSYVLIVSLVIGLCMSIFTEQLFHIFATNAYAPAMSIFPLVLLVRVVGIMEYPAAIGIYLVERTHWFALIYSVGIVLTLAGNLVLDPKYGFWGASGAWLCGWFAVVLLMRIVGQRFYPLSNDWKLWLFATLPWGLFLLTPHHILDKVLTIRPLQAALCLSIVLAFALLLASDIRSVNRNWISSEVPAHS